MTFLESTLPIRTTTRNLTRWLFTVGLATSALAQQTTPHQLKFLITFPSALQALPRDGRMLLAISTARDPEPRFGIDEEEAKSQQLFGIDVDSLQPGSPVTIDEKALGYPVRSLGQLPAGDYYVQAVLNIYETYKRADGRILKLPADRGEGQRWNQKPGNLFSTPQRVHTDPASGDAIPIVLSKKIPPVEVPKDTKYVKHFQVQSKLLSEFWGRPMYLGAVVVLPEGFDEHPEAHYPLLIAHNHFLADFNGFRTEPPSAEAKGSDLVRQRYQYALYKDWTSGRFPP